MVTTEREVAVASGWTALVVSIISGLVLLGALIAAVLGKNPFVIVTLALALGIWSFMLGGFFTLQPNEAAVLVLFGKYKGSARTQGFKWANPFYKKIKVSLRWRNFNGGTTKVNDLRGNPIDISAVVVWRVEDSAKAVFDVDHYDEFVSVQSEAALRHLAMSYPYDTFENDTLSLRGSTEEISDALKREVQDRVSKAGVSIEEARLNHLAYSPEIAGAMLQRQQADAVVAARSRIVEGAVGMVEMALDKLESYGKIQLDEERKASMVSNLLVVLCAHQPAQPIVNTGTLYS
ncbi:MAG: SPFH domain-containing protein [Candidatus Hydrogenedentes bacterium]|nr:SPFH domain-containing protein [Candidatus Hydrogenedentota bacterium]